MTEANPDDLLELFEKNEVEDEIDQDIKEKAKVNPQEVVALARLMKNETDMFKTMAQRLVDEQNKKKAQIKENKEKVKMNKQLPWLVGNVVELLTVENEAENEGILVHLFLLRLII